MRVFIIRGGKKKWGWEWGREGERLRLVAITIKATRDKKKFYEVCGLPGNFVVVGAQKGAGFYLGFFGNFFMSSKSAFLKNLKKLQQNSPRQRSPSIYSSTETRARISDQLLIIVF